MSQWDQADREHAAAEGKTVRELAFEEQVLPTDELDELLDPHRQTEPG